MALKLLIALSLLACGSEAAAVNFRGVHNVKVEGALRQQHVQSPEEQSALGATDWKSLGLGVGIGAVVAAVIAGLALKVMSGSSDASKEVDESGEKEAAVEETAVVTQEEEEDTLAESSQANEYQALMQVLAQKVAQEVGPKLSKAAAVKGVLDNRMSSFTEKARGFLLSEMNGTAGEVLRELDAPEAMMLLDFNQAVEANFPPASILIAGVLSPTMVNVMSIHHFIQMLSVGLPILILCSCAIYIDWAAPCSIPSIFAWLFTQTALAAMLVIGHGALVFKIFLGKRRLAAKAQEIHEKNMEDGHVDMREEFVGNTVILQEALLVEHEIRKSFWNFVVGFATFAWVLTTIWNLVLIIGWTFVPGVVAFHPKAAEVAKGDYCGAWMTVLVLRINMLLAVLFLFLNLATVVKWVCDLLIENQGFQNSVLDAARGMDKTSSGLPVCELLVKAFLLRGGSDTLDAKLANVLTNKNVLVKEQAELTAQLAQLDSEIVTAAAEEQTWKASAEAAGGNVAKQAATRTNGSTDLENWKEQGESALGEADAKARAVQEQTAQALEELWDKISQMVEAARNSETAKAMTAKYQELEAKFQEAMATMQDPEFQQQLRDAAQKATDQARDLADQAIQAAKDPEMQKKLNQMAQDAMAQAQKTAEDVAAAANDPVKRKELQEAAQKAMEQAQAAAAEAAAGLNDPEMQKKMKEAAKNAMDQAQLAAQSAVAAAQDPELQKKLKEAAQKAMDDAKIAAQKAADAVNDPELQKKLEEAAKKAMQDAKDAAEQAKVAAEQAKAAMQDPEMQKKLAEAAQKYKADAQAAAATIQEDATAAVAAATKK